MTAPVFPIFLKLSGRTVVVVGAGSVAASKLNQLLQAGAAVRVIAPDIGDNIDRPGVTVVRRRFRPEDLDDAWLVVAAATPDVNRAVSDAAATRRVFVNAVDDPPNATAYLGGVVRRGGVTLALSTDGRAPALAGLIREGLETVLPEHDLREWLDTAERERQVWRQRGVPMKERRRLLLDALVKRYDEKKTDER